MGLVAQQQSVPGVQAQMDAAAHMSSGLIGGRPIL